MSKESGTPVLVGDVESDAILGDCTSFAELRTSTSRSRNFGRISQSTNRTSRSRRSSFLGPIAEADASAMILKANAPPNYTNANMNGKTHSISTPTKHFVIYCIDYRYYEAN
jgi:hypothetical protein